MLKLRRPKPSITDAISLLLLFSVLYGKRWLLGDPGAGWHLRAGEIMLSHGSVLRNDPFLFSPSGAPPWVHDQWLGDVLFAYAMQHGGIAQLHVFASTLCIAAWAFVIGPLLHRTVASPAIAGAVILLCALMGGIQWFVRPVLFSFLLFAIVYRICIALHGTASKAGWVLPPLFAVWANLHPAFVLGLFLLAAAAVSLRSLHVVVLLIASAAATLLNPWGLGLWLSIKRLGSEGYFLKLNDEWLSPDLQHAAYLPVLIGAVIMLILLARENSRRLSFFETSSIAVFFALSLLHQRYIPFLGLTLALPLAKLCEGSGVRGPRLLRTLNLFSGKGGSICTAAAIVLLGVFAAVLATLPGVPYAQWEFPPADDATAIASLTKLPEGTPVYNGPDFGGVLIYGARNVRPLLDDRNQLLGPERYEEFFRIVRAGPGWRESLRAIGAEHLVLGRNYPLSWVLRADPDWAETISESSGVSVFTRGAP